MLLIQLPSSTTHIEEERAKTKRRGKTHFVSRSCRHSYKRVRSPLFPCNPQHQTLATKCNVNELIYNLFPYLFRLFVPFHVKALQRVFFTQEEYTAMLRLYNGRGMEEPPLVEEVACEWMKLNQDVWSQWKPFDLTAKTELYIGGIFPISGPFYKSGRGMVPGSRQSLTNRFALCVTSPYGPIQLLKWPLMPSIGTEPSSGTTTSSFW